MEIVKKKSIVGGPLCAKEGHDLCGGMKHGDNNRPAKVGAGPSGVVHLCPSVVAFVFSFFDGNRAIPIGCMVVVRAGSRFIYLAHVRDNTVSIRARSL